MTLAAAALVAAGLGYALLAQDPPAKADEAAEAGVKAAAAEFRKAFDAGDAKAVAALWTADAEYSGPDGETVRGRDAIEKMYAELFKAQPKATVESAPESVRALGRRAVVAEGTLTVKLPDDPEPGVSRYSALLVREDDGWRLASVREWVPDPATDVTPKDLGWLVGEWAAKGDGGELKITYAWDENKVFLHGKYTLTKDGKTVSSGMQVIGMNPGGGLRSWMFDSSGTTSDGVWVRDEKRWLQEAVGVLPDGTEVTSASVIIPLGPDSFTWQATDRAMNGEPLPALPPVKVTRVKK
jgi:uncharacterized protein (TIGR02246 family)